MLLIRLFTSERNVQTNEKVILGDVNHCYSVICLNSRIAVANLDSSFNSNRGNMLHTGIATGHYCWLSYGYQFAAVIPAEPDERVDTRFD